MSPVMEPIESTDVGKYRLTRLPLLFCLELEKILGDRVMVTTVVLEEHSHDFSYHEHHLPEAVLYVETPEEVAEVTQLCNAFRVPIIAVGSGTSLEGHIIPEGHGSVSLNMSRMKKVIKFHQEDMDVVVQPGITYDELNKYLEKFGCFFPLDPGPGASIGGMIGTSCSGTNAVRYGTAKEQVLSLKVVLADGSTVKTGTRSKKSSAGYDLTHLFIGSEGTLGIVVEATLKVQRIPEAKTIASITFDTLDSAAKTVIDMMQDNIRIGKVELLDKICIQAVNLSNDMTLPEKHTLLLEFSGSKVEVDDQIVRTQRICGNHTKDIMKWASTPEERAQLWRARKEALWSAPVLQPGSTVLITDACVPISRLSECLTETEKDIAESGLLAPMVAHAGDGNFHLFALFDPLDPKQVSSLHTLNSKLVQRAIDMEGTCTGEHGVGIGKKKYLRSQLGNEAVDVMKTIKVALDPRNILNPGKVIPE
jgi:D-lactate dehydrogenase (cytochrome)